MKQILALSLMAILTASPQAGLWSLEKHKLSGTPSAVNILFPSQSLTACAPVSSLAIRFVIRPGQEPRGRSIRQFGTPIPVRELVLLWPWEAKSESMRL
jgi:hypothetical protein